MQPTTIPERLIDTPLFFDLEESSSSSLAAPDIEVERAFAGSPRGHVGFLEVRWVCWSTRSCETGIRDVRRMG
jgi:hypothetical protein